MFGSVSHRLNVLTNATIQVEDAIQRNPSGSESLTSTAHQPQLPSPSGHAATPSAFEASAHDLSSNARNSRPYSQGDTDGNVEIDREELSSVAKRRKLGSSRVLPAESSQINRSSHEEEQTNLSANPGSSAMFSRTATKIEDSTSSRGIQTSRSRVPQHGPAIEANSSAEDADHGIVEEKTSPSTNVSQEEMPRASSINSRTMESTSNTQEEEGTDILSFGVNVLLSDDESELSSDEENDSEFLEALNSRFTEMMGIQAELDTFSHGRMPPDARVVLHDSDSEFENSPRHDVDNHSSDRDASPSRKTSLSRHKRKPNDVCDPNVDDHINDSAASGGKKALSQKKHQKTSSAANNMRLSEDACERRSVSPSRSSTTSRSGRHSSDERVAKLSSDISQSNAAVPSSSSRPVKRRKRERGQSRSRSSSRSAAQAKRRSPSVSRSNPKRRRRSTSRSESPSSLRARSPRHANAKRKRRKRRSASSSNTPARSNSRKRRSLSRSGTGDRNTQKTRKRRRPSLSNSRSLSPQRRSGKGAKHRRRYSPSSSTSSTHSPLRRSRSSSSGSRSHSHHSSLLPTSSVPWDGASSTSALKRSRSASSSRERRKSSKRKRRLSSPSRSRSSSNERHRKLRVPSPSSRFRKKRNRISCSESRSRSNSTPAYGVQGECQRRVAKQKGKRDGPESRSVSSSTLGSPNKRRKHTMEECVVKSELANGAQASLSSRSSSDSSSPYRKHSSITKRRSRSHQRAQEASSPAPLTRSSPGIPASRSSKKRKVSEPKPELATMPSEENTKSKSQDDSRVAGSSLSAEQVVKHEDGSSTPNSPDDPLIGPPRPPADLDANRDTSESSSGPSPSVRRKSIGAFGDDEDEHISDEDSDEEVVDTRVSEAYFVDSTKPKVCTRAFSILYVLACTIQVST